jgi:cell division protein FtsB
VEMAQITALIGAAASLLCTLVVGALTYFVKQTLNDFRKADERNAQKLAEVDKRHAANYKELTQQISDLKSDLPLVYVLREDFIRSMNNVDGKLDKIIGSLADKKGG